MSAAAENFKATAIANLKEEAEVEGFTKDSDVYKAKFRKIVADAEGMSTVAAPVAAPAKAKRQDPPWKTITEDFTCKDFDAALHRLQQLQKGEWTRDKPHFGYRLDDDKNKCKTWGQAQIKFTKTHPKQFLKQAQHT